MGRGRLAHVVLFLYSENYHVGETSPPHFMLLK